MIPLNQTKLNYINKLFGSYVYNSTDQPFDRWLAEEFKKHKQFGKRDRFLYSELLFSSLRYAYLSLFLSGVYSKFQKSNISEQDLDRCVDEYFAFTSHQPLVVLLKDVDLNLFFKFISLKYQDSIESCVFQFRVEDPVINEVFQRAKHYLSTKSDLHMKMLWNSIPVMFEGFLDRRIRASRWNDQQTHQFLKAHNSKPPIWIRINDSAKISELLEELEGRRFYYKKKDQAVLVQGNVSLYEFDSFKQGIFEVQDYASQSIGASIGAKPGQFIWDMCAGGGGKALQIASMMNNKGAVYASDIREHKLEEIKRRAKKAHFQNIRTYCWDGREINSFPKEVIKHGGFDWVLVDAPCSISGTWRRNPDIMLKFNQEILSSLIETQKSLLENGAKMLKPGGRLVYGTCSWFVEENEDVIGQFLSRSKQFNLLESKIVGSPDENCDTMFVSVVGSKLSP